MQLSLILAIVAGAATGLAATVAATSLNGAPAPRPIGKIAGDYVEARTASVMAGPCHYNGELVTTGRDAILAWNFAGGTYHGIDLAGLRAVAAVTSADNLGQSASRQTELAVDSSATDSQVAAVADLLRAKCGTQLGPIVHIRRTPVTFAHGDDGYFVQAAGFATMRVAYRTDNACCVQPYLVWYDPLSPIEHRKVGYTDVASYSGSIAAPWERRDEDSAFYGAFAF